MEKVLNVAPYCRVSTDDEDQKNSYETQKSYFEAYINRNLKWRFVGMYADKGITGTSTKKRKDFKRMIKDAEDGKIDLIVTKEVSRFARNTLDSIFYTRKLKDLGIGVFFINDNINTLDPDSELRLTIMSSIAQEESRKISERVKWAQKRQMEKGVVFGNSIYGYNLADGKLTVNEEQAKIVRMIFSMYLDDGMGSHILCHELEDRGILSPSGDVRWKNVSILRMLKNEKYVGILKQKKEITLDFLSHKKVVNDGREDFVIIEDNHEPIVDIEVFEAVQKEIERRRKTTLNKSNHSNRYVWSGKIECAYCHSKFKRKVWNRKSSNPATVWQCSENIKYGTEKLNEQGLKIGCNCKSLYEKMLSEYLLSALKSVTKSKDRIIKEIKRDLKTVLESKPDNSQSISEIQSSINKIGSKKTRLIELYTDGTITRADFDKSNDQYNSQFEALNKDLDLLAIEDSKTEDLKERFNAINQAVEKIASFDQFSEEVCKKVLHKIVVHSRDKISVYLNGGNNDTPFFIPLPITPWGSR